MDLTLLRPHAFREGIWVRRAGARDVDDGYRTVVGRLAGKSPNRVVFLSGLREAFDSVPDVVHVLTDENFWLTTQVVRRARAVRPRPRVVFHTWQNVPMSDACYPQPWHWLYRLDTRLERGVFSSAAGAVARNSEGVGVLRGRGFVGPIAHIPWGSDVGRFAFVPARENPSDPPVIGYVGRLVREKGIEDLRRAVEELRFPVVLRIVGDGPLAGEAATWRLSRGRVEWIRNVPKESIPDAYRGMDLLVLPSRTMRTWKEQFGRVLVEAMASGVPVLGSSSGAIPEVLGDAGAVFPEGDVRALARTIADLLADPSRRTRMSARGRERAETKYAWPVWAARTAEFLGACLGMDDAHRD
ncbi:MAG: glycosyltransferase family 4 protein [Nitrospirae bacterium]|nr:glycosyltransferase family 4 protein [Nitrospirota bacterium]